ncbi:MAG: flagellar biosynthesis anti-sigma factor FlgM [Desulfovibrio sp.]|nr:flagellar biosynthesis anti-sigma factor FlgM [Desulfovibrio sp.]
MQDNLAISNTLATTAETNTKPLDAESPLRNPKDSVSVSQDARLLAEASKTAQNAPDIRQEKVEALRIQVQNGTYRPDSTLIAASLLREEPGLFTL